MKYPIPTDDQIIESCKTAQSMAHACAKLNMHPVIFKKRATKLNAYKTNIGLKGTKKT